MTDTATFITIYHPNGVYASIGNGIWVTNDGEIATYTGQDVGTTDADCVVTYKGIQVFNIDDNTTSN